MCQPTTTIHPTVCIASRDVWPTCLYANLPENSVRRYTVAGTAQAYSSLFDRVAHNHDSCYWLLNSHHHCYHHMYSANQSTPVHQGTCFLQVGQEASDTAYQPVMDRQYSVLTRVHSHFQIVHAARPPPPPKVRPGTPLAVCKPQIGCVLVKSHSTPSHQLTLTACSTIVTVTPHVNWGAATDCATVPLW
jgi:hypothetical protein